MALEPGTRLGPYEITGPLGAGGMGEVYRARDDRLKRDVAIKVLPELFARDAERMARFQREAEVLASLNHPHIGAIYGVEDFESTTALVLELVEGETLSDLINARPLVMEEALEFARQVAEALEAAHEKGVIHRDLKPANLKVTPEGKIKVLDFGLAKALETERIETSASMSPTFTQAATVAGMVVGTAAYMSPEQARGSMVDKRADVWSFGVVLFEMLTGQRAFSGESVSDTLASVLKLPPDWNRIPSETPPVVQKLLRRCFEKDPQRRLRDIGEARIAITEYLADPSSASLLMNVAPAGEAAVARPHPALMAGAGLVVGSLLVMGAMWLFSPSVPDPPLRKFRLLAGHGYHWSSGAQQFALSPDGTQLAFLGDGRLWLRALDHSEPKELRQLEDPHFVFWSPDSAWIGYAASGKIWKTAVGGGEHTTVTDLKGALVGGSGATWDAADRIVYSEGSAGLYEVSAFGGDPRPFLETDPEQEGDFHDPHALPENKGILYLVHRKGKAADTLELVVDGERRVLLQLDGQILAHPIYSQTGHILYQRSPTNPGVWALPFSLASLEVTGEPFLVIPEATLPSVSGDGTLVYAEGIGAVETQLAWADRGGQIQGLIGEPQDYSVWPPRLSPDARSLVAAVRAVEGQDLWIQDVERGTRTRLTFNPLNESIPTWSPSGTEVAFQIGDSLQSMAIAVKPADGNGETVKLPGVGIACTYTPDGKQVVFARRNDETNWDLYYAPVSGEGEAQVFLMTEATEWIPAVSPDGNFVAYVSNESGRTEIYLKRFPSGEGKWQVSVEGGSWPVWNGSGDELFFAAGDAVMEVDVTLTPSVRLGTPRVLFVRKSLGRPLPFGLSPGFDVTRDGQRFVVLEPTGEDRPDTGIALVENWFSEFSQAR